VKEDDPRLGDVGVPRRFKPSDDFRRSVGPVTRLTRELVSSDARDARHRGRPVRGCRCRATGVRGFCRAPPEPAKRQGPVARPTYNADPPLLGSTMVGACIPNPANPAASGHLS
jgi:hypothetical protein